MARSRNIKPGFFTNEELAEIDPLGRLLFIGLWTLADREGRLEDRPKRIKIEILPYDNCDVDSLLTQLDDARFITRYVVNGKKYMQINKFIKHQNPHPKEAVSQIPAIMVDSGKDPDLQIESNLITRQVIGKQVASHEKDMTSRADSLQSDSLPLIPGSSLPLTSTSLRDEYTLSGNPDTAAEIVKYLNQRTGSEYRSTTKKTITLIKTRIKEGFTFADFVNVIDKKFEEWHDTKFQTYLRPETLFGTKFESYLNQKMARRKDVICGNPQTEMARRAIEILRQNDDGG